MSEPGYVYLLINHAMPGLVKVGLTNRSPGERVAELSSATGVPTPFELVYDVLVPDSLEAEQFIHSHLTALGYRLTDNREFFRAPIREVLRLMIHLRESMGSMPITLNRDLEPRVQEATEESNNRDALFAEAARVCVQDRQGSTSLLQRRLKVGCGRAVRIIDQLEAAGILGPPRGAAPRDVLVREPDIETYLGRLR
jgi:hypothetical protein